MISDERKDTCEGQEDTISTKTYNAIVGGCIIYGFLVMAITIFKWQSCVNEVPSSIQFGCFALCFGCGGIIAYVSKKALARFVGYTSFSVGIGTGLTLLISLNVKTVLEAAILTGVVAILMTLLSVACPSVFSGLKSALSFGLLFAAIVALVAVLLGVSIDFFSLIFVVCCSLNIGYDYRNAQKQSKTVNNAFCSAFELFLNAYLLFVTFVEIITKGKQKT